jgi:hypothetical protein
MAASRSRRLVALTGIAMLGAGCGSTAARIPTSARSQPAAGAAAVAVIRAWSTALRRGDVAGAARYFALPSLFANGSGDVIAIHTEAQARAANATLPCGATLISVDQRGRYLTALFRLTNRPGPDGGCGSGAGQLARTNFLIARGRILEWLRAPSLSGGAEPPGPAAPSTTAGGGPVV